MPALRKNPVFLYTEDDFKKPNPFSPDVVVPIDLGLRAKRSRASTRSSRSFTSGTPAFGYLEVLKDKAARLSWTRDRASKRYAALANRFRAKLIDLLGEEQGKAVKYAESFEVCEYGNQPTPRESC